MIKTTLITLCAAFLFSSQANSQFNDVTPELRAITDEELFKPHIGFTAGVGNPEGNLTPGGTYTLNVGYQPYIPISVSGEYQLSNYDNNRGSKLVRNALIAKIAYNYGGNVPFIRYSYIGIGAGPMWEDTHVDDKLALGILPNLGFDYPLSKVMNSPLSLGMNLSYLYTTTENPDVFNVNAVVKYWY